MPRPLVGGGLVEAERLTSGNMTFAEFTYIRHRGLKERVEAEFQPAFRNIAWTPRGELWVQVEMAMRFAIANPRLSTTEIGLANIDELEAAIRAVEIGPLSAAALARLRQLQAGFLGEAR